MKKLLLGGAVTLLGLLVISAASAVQPVPAPKKANPFEDPTPASLVIPPMLPAPGGAALTIGVPGDQATIQDAWRITVVLAASMRRSFPLPFRGC